MSLTLQVGEHANWEWHGITFHADTLIMLWIASFVLILLALLTKRKLTERPGRLQAAAEVVIEGLSDLPKSQMGERGMKYLPFIGTIFLLILTCNWLEAIPFNQFYDLLFTGWLGRPHGLELAAPTSDLNTTLGLALTAFTASVFFGIRERGGSYFKHFLQPVFLFLPINLIEELSKPFSLAIRLFGNIFAKVVILLILIKLIPFPLLYPLPVVMLSLFLGLIQAFIFSLLTTLYISNATTAHDHS